MNLSDLQYDDVGAEERRRYYDPMVEMKWIDLLPRDLVIEILSWLQPKDLCKLRCVSKSWADLLTRDKEFTARHIQRSKQNPQLLVRRYISDAIGKPNTNSKITIELTSIDMQGDVIDKFTGTIDGPVYTFLSCGPLSVLCCMYSLYICNPSVRQIVRVPFQPNARVHNVGFGYLPSTNEYKIAHMFSRSLEIFSFTSGESVKSGSWRLIGDCPIDGWADQNPVCANGTMYWALSSGWKDKSILCIDLKTEELSSVPYPAHESRNYSVTECVGLMGDLCVVGFSSDSMMDIWMMKDKKSWGIEYSVSFSPMCPKFLVHSDEESEEIMVHMEEEELIYYSFRRGNWRRAGYYKAMKTFIKPCFYYGSLISL